MRLSTFTYCLKEGMKNIGRNIWFSLASTAIISACIFLFCMFFALVANVQYMVKNAETTVGITVFFDENMAEADILAIGAAKAFYERGVKVPDEISLMGFDDLEIAQYMTPGLTTVKQQISAKGEKAVELLIRNINEPELTKQELILPVSLVERGSVRKIKTETT